MALLIHPASGCSRGINKWEQRRPATFRGSGIVTCDGVAIENALIVFNSIEHRLTAVGRTDEEGRFVLKTFQPDDGAASGKHKVRITKIEATGYDSLGHEAGFVNRLPARYADESGGLLATVESKHGNVFGFELTSDDNSVKQ